MDYEFRQDPWVERLFENLKSLGQVVVRPRPSRLPGFLSNSEVADYTKKTVANITTNDAVSASDNNECCLSGAVFLPSGRMVLTDWNNACLKLFNNKGILTHRLDLPNNPWDVKLLPNGRLVTTVPGEQLTFFVEVSAEKGMEIVDQFKTDCECWAVEPLGNDRLAMTCDPWSKSPNVKIFNYAGKLSAFYEKDNNKKPLFRYPEHISCDRAQQVLYVSDARMHSVAALTLGGCLLFRYVHKELQAPAGLTTDLQGNIYVCSRETNTVHQISKNGEFIRIILKDTVDCPRCICMEPEGESFILTGAGNRSCNEFITASFN